MNKFNIGDRVIERSSSRKGSIIEIKPPARGRQLYTVIFPEGAATVLEQNIEMDFNIEDPYERCKKGIFENCDKFRLVNTTYKINNSNNNTISSLKASKTLFKAYQFKPLLKFLSSNSRRILIADEVGLGKTIEAGHIMLELKAREEFKSALIICPNSLKLKWQTELNDKFGLSFKIYESLNDAIEDLRAHPQTARGILNYEKIRASKGKDEKNKQTEHTNSLIEFLQKNEHRKYSFVLCDEAHKLRNKDTQTYRGATGLLDYADAIVFLTATPIMLGMDDLYNLLHLLEPLKYDNKEVFRSIINANRPFIRALQLLNRNASLDEIKEVLTTSEIEIEYQIGDDTVEFGSISISDEYKDIPLYKHIIEELNQEDTFKLRAQLQIDISSMSHINNIFSRTRKRDISTEERQQTERNAHKELVTLHEEEQLIYDTVINNYVEENGGYINYYGEEEGMSQGSILGLIQNKRMAASSIAGYLIGKECQGDTSIINTIIEKYISIPDAKYEKLCQIITGIRNEKATKLIVFSTFKVTIYYLLARLKKAGINTYVIHGDIKDRNTIIEQFKNDKKFSVLLSTEVGSEGLDMQFCSHMVNYDLPWNPMVVEQRIGRIDRFGQVSPKVHIYNLVVANSIQVKIYDLLLSRIGVFKEVIGELEIILEENNNDIIKLENEIYGTQLTLKEQEEKIIALAKAKEREKLDLIDVEEGLTNTLTNDIYFRDEIEKIRRNKLYVTDSELKNYISMLTKEHLTTCSFDRIDDNIYSITVPKSTPKVFSNFLTENQPIGEDYENLFRIYKQDFQFDIAEYGNRKLTFNQQLAFENKYLDYVNIYNPIIVATSCYFKQKLKDLGNTFKLKLHKTDYETLQPGAYFMAVFVVNATTTKLGKKISSDTLIPILYDIKQDKLVEDEKQVHDLLATIQSNGQNVALGEDTFQVEDDVYDIMCSDFTDYISTYRKHKQEDIIMREESQRRLSISQTDKYYETRKEREQRRIDLLKNLIPLSDLNNRKKLENDLLLAQNRLKIIEDDYASTLERLQSEELPKLTDNLISICKILIL